MNQPTSYPQDPKFLWDKFYELTQVPRPSKKEEKVRAYLIDQAKSNNLKYKEDQTGNIVIYVPATEGYENHLPVIIQNHVDMVCDKTPDKTFNFEEDPIDVYVKDGWVCANDTTLGADNGIGCAAALALIYDKNVSHPPLELLFTVDEETGLNGAIGLDPSMVTGKRMINMDTEEWGAIYIGCAGGEDYEMFGECRLEKADKNYSSFRLEVKNLKGGHSGLDIHRSRGNAIKLLTEILWEIRDLDYELSGFIGGKAHNIIPRDTFAMIRTERNNLKLLEDICQKKAEDFKNYLPLEDHQFEIIVTTITDDPTSVISRKDRDRILGLLNLFPHGAYSFNWSSQEPLVNYSSNMAVVRLEGKDFYLQTSLRYFDYLEINGLTQKLEALAYLFKLELKKGSGYPSWKPEFENNDLLKLAQKVFVNAFSKEAKVKAIHAGLECGLLKEKLGEMDIISIGPNIQGAHSPTEKLEIDSTNKFYNFLVKILQEL